tara:strand:- start:3879 stop:4817 length:939 start_codon:yes stop_codon:yes gene_type:complete
MSNLNAEPEIMEENSVVVEDDSSFEIEVIDDTPEEDKGKPRRAEDSKPDIPEDDEIASYSEGVQKRIKQLKFEYHEERRAKEESARLQEEALRYAQQMKAENESLKKTLDDGEKTLIGQAQARIESQLNSAKAEYKAAHEVGDPDALIAADEKKTALQIELDRVKNYRPQRRQVQPAPQPQYQQPTQQPPKPDQRAIEWGKRNDWFEKDPEMTGYAYGLHQKLVSEGIDPRSDRYYDEIDRHVRRVFPDKFDDGKFEEEAPQRQNGPVVAAPSKTTKRPRTVRLTSTQASLAKRLGLTNEQYAAQLMKEASK